MSAANWRRDERLLSCFTRLAQVSLLGGGSDQGCSPPTHASQSGKASCRANGAHERNHELRGCTTRVGPCLPERLSDELPQARRESEPQESPQHPGPANSGLGSAAAGGMAWRQNASNAPKEKRTEFKFKSMLTNCIYETLSKRSGWRETEKDDWDFIWADKDWIRMHLDEVRHHLAPHVKINHFRNHYELTRKDHMVKNLKRMVSTLRR